jgi:hypothetical protein
MPQCTQPSTIVQEGREGAGGDPKGAMTQAMYAHVNKRIIIIKTRRIKC